MGPPPRRYSEKMPETRQTYGYEMDAPGAPLLRSGRTAATRRSAERAKRRSASAVVPGSTSRVSWASASAERPSSAAPSARARPQSARPPSARPESAHRNRSAPSTPRDGAGTAAGAGALGDLTAQEREYLLSIAEDGGEHEIDAM